MDEASNHTPDDTEQTRTYEPLSWDVLRATCAELGNGAFIASVQSDGRPHVAWVVPGWSDERLWFSTFKSSQKATNLRSHNEVAVHWLQRPDAIVFGRATARLVNDSNESSDLWDRQVLPYDLSTFFGTKDNPELQFVELIPSRITIRSLDPTVSPRRWTPTDPA